jgi:hypothetical protein
VHHKAVTGPLSEMRHRLYQVCIQRSARQTRPTALGKAKAKPLRAARATSALRPGGWKSLAPGTLVSIPVALREHVL